MRAKWRKKRVRRLKPSKQLDHSVSALPPIANTIT
ncbi:hypothetical protein PAAG_00395 [Paracoccidioides lutzii Pb01]|uniref:60S ribosomal protein L41 n=1 Tax=Paracoccidioides lutzii (strain ATCC MYA-826 / Pb01) TaxID=502779 RepID=C1GPF0_PARBA|nr:hypothetical protein PAAG_00395 [Paracoccidioides lutzii Pb01]EEH36072.2 hypothetical protein PAAG_00395 [Paracoccidioides lutzii Pb01]